MKTFDELNAEQQFAYRMGAFDAAHKWASLDTVETYDRLFDVMVDAALDKFPFDDLLIQETVNGVYDEWFWHMLNAVLTALKDSPDG
jgi:hypothetical protein